ncbi:hypothetical protein KSF73_05385 [Burkholderiaceae bacterium DAT-1]|nr:hypothetical protein [Burkholderiaceae bacterium DAT-1]
MSGQHGLRIRERITHTLRTSSQHWTYPWLTGCLAFLSTITVMMPVSTILSVAVLINPRRWLTLYIFTTLGASQGGALLVWATQLYGLDLLDTLFPGIMAGDTWQHAQTQVGRYGAAAIAVISATPFPQTPALIVSALAGMSPLTAMLALMIGKAAKYGVVAITCSRFPHLLTRWWPHNR